LGSVVAHNNTSEEQVHLLNLRANVLEWAIKQELLTKFRLFFAFPFKT